MGFIDREPLPGIHHIEDALGVCFTLIVGEKRALLVDAGYGVENVAAYVRGITDLPVTLWLTHGHHDHALGAMWFDAARLHPADCGVYAEYTGERWRRWALLSARNRGVAVDQDAWLSRPMPAPTLIKGEWIDLGGIEARIIPCSGHTPGSSVVWVPQRKLLLTGDDWNACTWLFFPEALDARTYRDNLRGLLALPFERALCPHRTELYPRTTLEAFAEGLTDAALDAAPSSRTGAPYGVRTRELALPGGQTLVFDGDKLSPRDDR